MNCLFCKIINNEIPSFCFYEDDLVKVILDISPSTNGDSLIITKKHFESIFDLDEKTFNHLHSVIKKIYPFFEEKLKCHGLTIVTNNHYGQDIKHFHVHLTPRYENDQIKNTSNKEILKSLEEIYRSLMNKRD